MGYKSNRKIQNLYLLDVIKAKVLNFSHYDSDGTLKSEYALTDAELLALKELGCANAISIFEVEHPNESVKRQRGNVSSKLTGSGY